MKVDKIFQKAQKCKLCYGNVPIYVPLPDPNNGKTNVKIMFVNERPGRIGTGKSGFVSFDNKDPSASHFRDCFLQLGLSRKEIFITNVCLCHPKFAGYIDKTPSIREIKNCHFWLKKQIEAVKPKLLVTIGSIPLKSLRLLFSKSDQLKRFKLKYNIGESIKETKPWIYPLYHTSLKARLTRNTKKQRRDWLKIKEALKLCIN